MKNPKNTKNYDLELIDDRLVISPVRYHGLNKLYQINLSKVLNGIECPSPRRQIHVQNPEQLLIINSNQSMQSVELPSHQLSSELRNKMSLRAKKSHKQTFEKSLNKHLRFHNKSSSEKLRNKLQLEIEDARRQQPFVYISEKKMHESSFEAHIRKKDYWKINDKLPIKKIANNRLPSKNKLKSKIILPDLKPFQKKMEPLKSNIPLITRDNQELKYIKAQCFAILQYPDNILVTTFRGSSSYEIASLTKIMTFYCVRKIAQKNNIDLATEQTVIADHIMNITGTSAQLLGGQVYTVEQLLYGLMLPSGNDAATCLAEWAGKYLTTQQDYKLRHKAFINEMNKSSKELGLTITRFGNPHGLPHPDSRSTAIQVARLCGHLLNDELFRKIIKAQQYMCEVENHKGIRREVKWQNTNKLLRREGFIGVKTGITVTAGPCLASAFEFKNKVYIIVLLRANKISRRFKESRKILYWALQKIHRNALTGEQYQALIQLKRNKPDLDSDYSEDEQEFNYDQSDQKEFKKRCSIISYQM